MKIIVDQTLCSGHARCASVAPELYDLNDDGYVAFANRDVPADLEAAARRGARACPERAIQVVESSEADT